MRRHIPGLHQQTRGGEVLEGMFLTRVEHISHRWRSSKPFFAIGFLVLEPKKHRGRLLNARIYCTPKALWKLNWFLRDFGYDQDLMGQDQIDEKRVVGLSGIVRTCQVKVNGNAFLNFEGFAPAAQWDEVSTPLPANDRLGVSL